MLTGLIVGLIFLTIITIRIITNHITILQKQKEAQELEVIDLSQGLAKDDPSVIVLGTNDEFVNPFNVQGGYPAPATATEGQPLMAGYPPDGPVMSAGEGPTAPPSF